jgi:hypothetical protein
MPFLKKMVRYSAFVTHCRRKGTRRESSSVIYRFRCAHDSVGRKIPCSILIQFGTSMELIKLINACLNKTYSKVSQEIM